MFRQGVNMKAMSYAENHSIIRRLFCCNTDCVGLRSLRGFSAPNFQSSDLSLWSAVNQCHIAVVGPVMHEHSHPPVAHVRERARRISR